MSSGDNDGTPTPRQLASQCHWWTLYPGPNSIMWPNCKLFRGVGSITAIVIDSFKIWHFPLGIPLYLVNVIVPTTLIPIRPPERGLSRRSPPTSPNAGWDPVHKGVQWMGRSRPEWDMCKFRIWCASLKWASSVHVGGGQQYYWRANWPRHLFIIGLTRGLALHLTIFCKCCRMSFRFLGFQP